MFSLGFGHSQSHGHRLAHSHRMTQTQSHAVSLELAQRRLDLVNAINDETYLPWATCGDQGSTPGCGHSFSLLDIMRGFTNDPADRTTKCPKCGRRQNAILRRTSDHSAAEIPFWCSHQTVVRLRDYGPMSLADLQHKDAGTFHSAVVHFGSIANAYKQAGFSDYTQRDALKGWEKIVEPCLGKMPDKMIAEVLGFTARRIGKLRRLKDIPVFRRSDLMS